MSINVKILLLLSLLRFTDLFIKDTFFMIIPFIVDEFNLGAVSISLLISLPKLGEGLGQIFWGNLADKFGRKTILIGSELLLIGISIIMLSPIGAFILVICRFCQGLSISGKVIGSHMIFADVTKNHIQMLAQHYALFKVLLLLLGIIIPVFGFYLVQLYSWKVLIILLIVTKVIYLYCYLTSLPETLQHLPPALSFKDFWSLIRCYQYLQSCALGILTYMWIYSYFNALVIYQEFPNLIPISHSINLFMAAIGGVTNAYYLQFYSAQKLMLFASVIMILGAIGNAWITFAFDIQNLYPLIGITLFCSLISFGITFITSNSLSLATQSAPYHIGLALSLYGALQFTISSLYTILIGLFASIYPIADVIAYSTLLISILILTLCFSLGKKDLS